ncbi:MAG TPA: PilZ domain-containing protein [Sphingomicrobium sp.]|nr:PilZ domain-containing protein [Sphingomicrobium sp.]
MRQSQVEVWLGHGDQLEVPRDRRRCRRLPMAGYAARLDALGDRGLCGVINLSDTGALLQSNIPLSRGDPVRISFDCKNSLQGRVAWNDGGYAGIRFLVPVATFGLIGKLANDRWTGVARPPRLTINAPALAKKMGSTSFHTVVGNISQKGFMIWHAGQLNPDDDVHVTLQNGINVHGTVR